MLYTIYFCCITLRIENGGPLPTSSAGFAGPCRRPAGRPAGSSSGRYRVERGGPARDLPPATPRPRGFKIFGMLLTLQGQGVKS